MSNTEIQEVLNGNLAIAELMMPKGNPLLNIREAKYHSSWDWLMPVVEKINSICSERGGELSNHSRDQEHLNNPLDNPLHWKSWSYHYVTITTDINLVWTRVIKFIQWYNQNKNP